MNMYNPSGNMYGQPVSGNHSDRMEVAPACIWQFPAVH